MARRRMLTDDIIIITLKCPLSHISNAKTVVSTRSRSKAGRPPKFHGARRPITATLPEQTLDLLAAIDSDRARAIVKATAAAFSLDDQRQKPVELVQIAPGWAIVTIGPNRLLAGIPWLRLVELAPTRFLLSVPTGTSVDSLELAIIELLENADADDRERAMLEQLRDLVRRVRRRGDFSKAEILLVETRASDPLTRR